MAKTGSDYERFVLTIQQAILNSEEFSKQKNIKIELNKKIVDNTGTEREFDLYWEYELAGITYKTIIECKDYNSKISVEKIDALIGKIKDLPDIKPVFATKTGYQSGAETKAKHNKIDLLIVREQIEDDWKDKNGNPFIKKIFIRLIALPAPEIINFQTFVDEDWIIKNTNIDTTKPIAMQGMNNEIFIYDENKNEQYSLQELSKKTSEEDEEITKDTFRHIEIFENAYIDYNNVKLKLKKFLFDYIRQNPIESNIEIDITKELIGVIEYINQNKKTAVFKDRVIKDWN